MSVATLFVDSCGLRLVVQPRKPVQKCTLRYATVDSNRENELTAREEEGEMKSFNKWALCIFPGLRLGLCGTVPTLLSFPHGQQTHTTPFYLTIEEIIILGSEISTVVI